MTSTRSGASPHACCAAPHPRARLQRTTSTNGLLSVVQARRPVAAPSSRTTSIRSTRSSRRSRGVVPKDHGLTLDDIASATLPRVLRQELGAASIPELHDVFYNRRFLEEVKVVLERAVRQAHDDAVQHLRAAPHRPRAAPRRSDVPRRRVSRTRPCGCRTSWRKSGLFTDYLVKMAQVITWWYRGEEGTFTYWPDGPFEPPQKLEHPLWNKGVVVQNEMMFHRGDPVGPPDERAHRGSQAPLAASATTHATTDGSITTDGDVDPALPDRRRSDSWRTGTPRSTPTWTRCKKVMDHTDDLTHDQVVDTLIKDMRARGVSVAEPSDPLHDIRLHSDADAHLRRVADDRLAHCRRVNSSATRAMSPVVLARICVRFSR